MRRWKAWRTILGEPVVPDVVNSTAKSASELRGGPMGATVSCSESAAATPHRRQQSDPLAGSSRSSKSWQPTRPHATRAATTTSARRDATATRDPRKATRVLARRSPAARSAVAGYSTASCTIVVVKSSSVVAKPSVGIGVAVEGSELTDGPELDEAIPERVASSQLFELDHDGGQVQGVDGQVASEEGGVLLNLRRRRSLLVDDSVQNERDARERFLPIHRLRPLWWASRNALHCPPQSSRDFERTGHFGVELDLADVLSVEESEELEPLPVSIVEPGPGRGGGLDAELLEPWPAPGMIGAARKTQVYQGGRCHAAERCAVVGDLANERGVLAARQRVSMRVQLNIDARRCRRGDFVRAHQSAHALLTQERRVHAEVSRQGEQKRLAFR